VKRAFADRILVDTGPLVAILSPRDQFHDACIRALKDHAPPLYTCWPVLTEAAWLLRFDPDAVERLLKSAATGLFRILTLDETDAPAIASILRKYRRLKPQLADAALVHLAQRESIETIFTVGRRDFGVYRPAPNRTFRIVPEI
jgi:predicted nucleic acid-binding protein